MDKKARYSDEELEEFRSIINDKLKVARTEYTALMNQLMNKDGNGTDDTSPTYNKVLDEGSANQSKEEMIQMSKNDNVKEVAKIFKENLKEVNQDLKIQNQLVQKIQARRKSKEQNINKGLTRK